jgi:hypothetical protein
LSGPSVNIQNYVGDLNIGRLDVGGAQIYQDSGNFIYTGDIITQGNLLNIAAPFGSIILNGSINTTPIGFGGRGGDVDLLARNEITISGSITTSGNRAPSGNVFLAAKGVTPDGSGNRNITVGDIVTSSLNNLRGDVIILQTFSIGSVVILIATVMLGLAIVYRYGPSREQPRWRWVSWGAVIATVLWVIGSVLFSVYVTRFGNYNETYGSVGAIVILLMWFLLSAYAVLIGAEVNAEMERQTRKDTTAEGDKPMGRRGAYAADTVGESR